MRSGRPMDPPWPARRRSTGRTNSSKVTKTLTGLPGSPNRYAGRPSTAARPNANGRPGLIATRHTSSWPMPENAALTWSWAPTLTPPLRTTTSPQADRLAQERQQVRQGVGGDPHPAHLGARFRGLGGERERVALVDLRGPQGLTRRDQLVTGRDHRDPRPAVDHDCGVTGRREQRDRRRIEDAPALEQRRAGGDVGAREAHVAAGPRGGADRDGRRDLRGAGGRVRVLDRHHGVRPGRHHRAGHDPERRPGAHLVVRRAAGRHLAQDPEHHRPLGSMPRPRRLPGPRSRPWRCSARAAGSGRSGRARRAPGPRHRRGRRSRPAGPRCRRAPGCGPRRAGSGRAGRAWMRSVRRAGQAGGGRPDRQDTPGARPARRSADAPCDPAGPLRLRLRRETGPAKPKRRSGPSDQ